MSELKVSAGAHTSMTAKLDEFPFRSEFSLAPLIRYWEREIAGGYSALGDVARRQECPVVLTQGAELKRVDQATHHDVSDLLKG
jgi:hypothetical protein